MSSRRITLTLAPGIPIRIAVALLMLTISSALLMGDTASGHATVMVVQPSTQATQPLWKDTGLPWPEHEGLLCLDASRPHIFFVNETGTGTVSYNWETRQRTIINAHPFDLCGPRGLLYSHAEEGALRYSLADPVGRTIDHLPTQVSYDGSLTVYSVTNSRLWASQDGGLTWVESTAPSGTAFEGTLVVSEADAQALYAVVYPLLPVPPQTYISGQVLIFSSNGGRTWEERGSANPPPTDTTEGYTNNWDAMPGASSPVNFLLRSSYAECCGPGSIGTELWLSSNGSRSLVHPSLGTRTARSTIQIVNTPRGIVRYHQDLGDVRKLDRSTDGGQTWQPLQPPNSLYYLGAARGVPGVLFLETVGAVTKPGGDLFYSLNSGNTWDNLTDYTDFTVWDRTGGGYSYTPYRLDVTPYFPVTLLGTKDGRMQVLELPADGSGMLAPALADQNPGVLYFPETGHNVRGIFTDYWSSHGGLAQQGYPLTEPFEQVSDVDGKVYLTQYFERAVFELHPENQPPYTVLLSLLGTETYNQKYGSAGAPNQRASSDNPLYFSQTGHTVGGRFRQYWEQHGGLAQQGYPISDEFQEVSAVDGKTYTVQYFQRAEFGYHLENEPPNDVLLAQLGTLKTEQLGTTQP